MFAQEVCADAEAHSTCMGREEQVLAVADADARMVCLTLIA